MKKKSLIIILLVLLFVVIFPIGSCVSTYNKIIQADETTQMAFADIQSNLLRRSELIPNLVNTVKGSANHEKETLQAVIDARSKAATLQLTSDDLSNPELLEQFSQAQNQMSSALSRLMVSVERYPDLKANQSFRDLQAQLEGTENRINVARTRYNESVNKFNSTIRRFPASIINNFFLSLEKKAYYQVAEEATINPEVQF